MKTPRKFYEPLAIGAPQPYRDLAVAPDGTLVL